MFLKYICLCLIPFAAWAQKVPEILRIESLIQTDEGTETVATSMGFLVEEEGFLISTYQNLVDPTTGELFTHFRVSGADTTVEERLPARIIGVEPTLNFSVLKIEGEHRFEPSQIAQKTEITPGQAIYSATNASRPLEGLAEGQLIALNSLECYQESLTQTMYRAGIEIPQTGVSSPIFDHEGQILAIYTGYESPNQANDHLDEEGITHLLPTFLAFNIYESIKRRQSLASPWTGFSVRRLNEAEQAQFPIAEGKFIGGIAFEYIWENSPAEKMGLQVGDILVRFAHYPILEPAHFQKWLYMYGVGETVDLFIYRDGEIMVNEYTIEERPDWAVPQ